MLSLPAKSVALLVALLMFSSTDALAQSGGGTRYAAPQQAAPQQAAPPQHTHSGSTHSHAGSGTSQPVAHTAALEGYCPVCLVNMRKWVVGRPEFATDYDGHHYVFPGEKQRGMFLADPAKYAPVLGGNDIVEFARSGKRLQGNVRHGATYEGRHYFFASAANKQVFSASPVSYANTDVAFGGKCIVCQVDSNHDMAGDPNIVATHNGMRFYFPDDSARQAFQANPAHYANHADQHGHAMDNGSAHQHAAPQPAGSGSSSH